MYNYCSKKNRKIYHTIIFVIILEFVRCDHVHEAEDLCVGAGGSGQAQAWDVDLYLLALLEVKGLKTIKESYGSRKFQEKPTKNKLLLAILYRFV